MTDSEYKKMFPVSINLCKKREVTDYDKEPGKNGERPKKTVTDCPTLYIRGIDGLDKLPEDGYVLIKVHRSELKIIDRTPGKSENTMMAYPGDSEQKGTTMDAELEVHSICLTKEEEEDDGEDKEMGGFSEAMDKAAEKMGLKSKSTAPSGGEEDDDEGDEEY